MLKFIFNTKFDYLFRRMDKLIKSDCWLIFGDNANFTYIINLIKINIKWILIVKDLKQVIRDLAIYTQPTQAPGPTNCSFRTIFSNLISLLL